MRSQSTATFTATSWQTSSKFQHAGEDNRYEYITPVCTWATNEAGDINFPLTLVEELSPFYSNITGLPHEVFFTIFFLSP
jgi:hypothetical protein